MFRAVTSVDSAIQEIRRSVRSFLAREIDEGRFTVEADTWMSRRDPDFSRRLAVRVWVGMTIPVEFGGHGRSALERLIVTEELFGARLTAHWIADRQIGRSIVANGTLDQSEPKLGIKPETVQSKLDVRSDLMFNHER
jgi:alkylation response protein AidB-like acyl-CoA dehydrogenase